MQCNIILLVVDAISYKHSWLKDDLTMPKLYSMKDQFYNFNNHFSVAANTKANIASMLSGVYPSLHKVSSREHSFESNTYGFVQEELNKLNYVTSFFNGAPLNHADNDKYKFNFLDFNLLSPSMADYYIPGEEYNNMNYKKIEELSIKNPYFLYLHYHDAHQPFEIPSLKITKKKYPLLWKYKLNLKEIIKSLKNDLSLKRKFSNIKTNFPLLEDNFYRPSIRIERYKNFYNDIYSNSELFKEYEKMLEESLIYQDNVLSEFINNIKNKYSKNTVIFMVADHGSQIKAPFHEDNTYLYDEMLHIPMSIITFDEKIKKKINLKIDNHELTSNTDLYNTFLSLAGTNNTPNQYEQNLVDLESKDRFIMAEYYGRKLKYNEIKLFDLNNSYDYKFEAKNLIEDLISKNKLFNSDNNSIYQEFKTNYNNAYKKRKFF